jgi:hypothetical protein
VCARVPVCHVCVRHGMRGDVCTQSCASVWLCRGSSVRRGRARDGDWPHMHVRPRHGPADTPARFRTATPLSTSPNTAMMRSRRRRSRPRLRSTLRRSTSPTKTRTRSSWCLLASEWRRVCPRCCWLAPISNIPTRCVYRMCSLYSRKCRCVCIGYAFVCVCVFMYIFVCVCV